MTTPRADADTHAGHTAATMAGLGHRFGPPAAAVGAGLAVAASMPPWGWWPLAFVGFAGLDRLTTRPDRRFRGRMAALFALAWLMPATVWMWALTIPGYLVVGPLFAAAFGVLVALVPLGQGRRAGLVAVTILWEAARWAFPFGGVPLATVAMSQADSPLAGGARLFGPLLLVAATVIAGLGLSALADRHFRTATACVALVVAVPLAGSVAPRATAVGEIRVALVQGGGEQGTRAIDTDPEVVFQRHLDASELVVGPVDLVVWPENAIDTADRLENTDKWPVLVDLAERLDAIVVVGVTEDISDDAFVNSSVAISPSGRSLDRYEKRIRVPFGEYVPLRGLIEPLAPDYLPRRDAAAGATDAVLSTPVGELGVAISWEVFFDRRAKAAVDDGAEVLVNPTNGSSYWLTIVQTQQVASSRLRAIESDRWLLQVSPTGFSAIVTPDGEVIDRTAISEQAVVHGTVERRQGTTLASRWGQLPMLVAALCLVAWAAMVDRRAHLRPPPRGATRRSDLDGDGDGSVVDERHGHVGSEPPGGHHRAGGP